MPRDDVLEQAMDRISDLATTVWAVRDLHSPRRSRHLLTGERTACAACGHRWPCQTALIARGR